MLLVGTVLHRWYRGFDSPADLIYSVPEKNDVQIRATYGAKEVWLSYKQICSVPENDDMQSNNIFFAVEILLPPYPSTLVPLQPHSGTTYC